MNTQHQVADAVGRLLDDDGGQSRQKTRRNAQQQHELLVRQMRLTPGVETVDPVAEALLRHVARFFPTAKIEKLFLSSHH